MFTPHTVGDDGVTMSLWRSDAVMVNAMYKPGTHRTQVERQKRDVIVDRTSFTRFRVIEARGRWGGVDPVEVAGKPSQVRLPARFRSNAACDRCMPDLAKLL